MKATKFLLSVVSMLVFATACMDDLNNDAGLADKVVKLIPYTVTAQNQDDTKVTLEGEEDLIFQEKDKLVITSEDETVTGDLLVSARVSNPSGEWAVTYSLDDDIESSNTSTTVSDKGSYSTTLTAKSYFSVSCWMDGTWYGGASQDDKSGNYVFTLTIPSVTYDFTITAYIK